MYAASISDIQWLYFKIKRRNKSNGEGIKKQNQEIESIDLSKLEDVKLESAKEEKEITPIENDSDVIKFGHAIITEASPSRS